ncbi:hypothetical protein V8C34DRAFT_276545 [Trichoderma compactum]
MGDSRGQRMLITIQHIPLGAFFLFAILFYFSSSYFGEGQANDWKSHVVTGFDSALVWTYIYYVPISVTTFLIDSTLITLNPVLLFLCELWVMRV